MVGEEGADTTAERGSMVVSMKMCNGRTGIEEGTHDRLQVMTWLRPMRHDCLRFWTHEPFLAMVCAMTTRTGHKGSLKQSR